MLRALGTHIINQWMGALSLFLVLGGGAAYAVDTIGSEDIIDNSIRTMDLGNNEVRSADVRDDSLIAGGLGAADLAPGSVRLSELDPLVFWGADIAPLGVNAPFAIPEDAIQGIEVSDGSITGADVNETTLAGLDGHEGHRDLCDTPSDNSFRDCLSVTFDIGRSMHVLVTYGGGGSHGSYGYADWAYGECKTKLDGADRLYPVNIANESGTPVGMATIVDLISVGPGSHTVTLACRENPSDLHFEDLHITVLELAVD